MSAMKPLYLFAEFTRLDEAEHIVEGYCFVNETVDGEGGIRVTRQAMEDATPEYLRWGAVRSMHQPLAAGTALGIEWDEKGALLRARIVDDQEWRKVTGGVYKGFSIGIQPKLIRNQCVETALWIENSLVDRPRDWDALFTMFRIDDWDPAATEMCEIIEDAIPR